MHAPTIDSAVIITYLWFTENQLQVDNSQTHAVFTHAFENLQSFSNF